MSYAPSLRPIDPLRGPLDVTIADGTTWSSSEWSNLTHRGVSILVSSSRAVTLHVDHASSSETLISAPLSSQHAVGSTVPAAFHRRLDGRVSRVRITNASGADASVTVDVILRPTAGDHASMRLTLAGEEVSAGNPLFTAGAVVGDVDVVQAVASSLNAQVHGWDGAATQPILVDTTGRVETRLLSSLTDSVTAEPGAGSFSVTQSGTVTVDASALDTRALTSATDSVTVTGTVLVNPGGLNLPATVFQDDPTELHATVVQAGPVTTQGNSLLVKTVVVSASSAVQFLVDLPCTLHGYSFTTTAARAVVHYYDADSTDSVTTETVPVFSVPVETNQTALSFGNGDHITFARGLAVRINDNYSHTGTTGPGTSSITVYYRLV